MNTKTIERTAICYWSSDNDCYLVSSTLFIPTTAEGDSPEEAWDNFRHYVADTYEAYINGEHIMSPESEEPNVGESMRTYLETDIDLSTKAQLDELSERFECSIGEVIDYLAGFHNIALVPDKPHTESSTVPLSKE